jgi:hypothetical protein
MYKYLDFVLQNVSRSENDGENEGQARFETGHAGTRMSQSGRLSLGSEIGSPVSNRVSRDTRPSFGIYRGGGAVMGGVEPLYDYAHEALNLEPFEEEDEDERSGLVDESRHPALRIGVVRGTAM